MKILDKIREEHGVIRAAVYSRFSSDMQREESIEAQERSIQEFARSHGIVIVDYYRDRAKSGTSADREAFQAMLQDSAKGKFHLVLVHKLDRFARSRQDSMNARFQLKRSGVSVIASAQPFDSESPEGMMMEAMLEAMAEYYSRNLAAEVEKGKRENALKGLHVGGRPPFGYEVDRETMRLVVNPVEAEGVRLIFQQFANRVGYERISQELRRRGYKTKMGRPFGKNSLNSILRNEKYTGVYVYSKSAHKDVDGKRNGHAYKKDSEIIRVENACPAIISKELFQQVQERMTKRQRNQEGGRATAKEVYLLSGKMVCGECGCNYEGIRRKPCGTHKTLSVSYRCGRHNKSVKCGNGEINRDAVEVHVLERLGQLVYNDELIPEIVNGYNRFQADRNEGAAHGVEALRDTIAQLDAKIANIIAVIEATGSLASADRLKQLEAEKMEAENSLYILEQELDAHKITVDELREAFRTARDLLQKKSLPNVQQLVNSFVDRVVLYSDRVEISFHLGFKTDVFKDIAAESAEKAAQQKESPSQDNSREGACGGEGPRTQAITRWKVALSCRRTNPVIFRKEIRNR